ncbi:hypothetical protein SEA_PHINKY_46 [Microbacterium phage Phinky]|nr:hypothetical protein SEA_PHINKY_46 [Microbacterium phage Phinky]
MGGPTPRTALSRGRDVETRLQLLELRPLILPERLVSALSTADDANELVGTGSFWVMPTTLNSPPTTAHYVIEQYELTSGTRYQLATRIGTPTNQIFTERWTRTRTGSGAWTAWNPISLQTTAFTPVATGGLTLGNSTVTATYSIADGVLFGRIIVTLGSTAVVNGDIQFDHPPIRYSGTTRSAGQTRMTDASTGINYPGTVLVNSTRLYARLIATTDTVYPREMPASASGPFPWTTGDTLAIDFSYPIL